MHPGWSVKGKAYMVGWASSGDSVTWSRHGISITHGECYNFNLNPERSRRVSGLETPCSAPKLSEDPEARGSFPLPHKRLAWRDTSPFRLGTDCQERTVGLSCLPLSLSLLPPGPLLQMFPSQLSLTWDGQPPCFQVASECENSASV